MYFGLFFVFYMLITHVVILSLIVAVLVEKFNRMSDRVAGYKNIL